MTVQSRVFNGHDEMVQFVSSLVTGGQHQLRDIQIVTIHRPNGLGYYHPAYLVLWGT